MIGILDSGRGGLIAAEYIEGLTDEGILFFPDRKNAPYGTKMRSELIKLVKRGVDLLSELGCDKILVACCTAGTVCREICPQGRSQVYPIIEPTASAALAATENGRIAVLATEATVRSNCFCTELHKLCQGARAEVLSLSAQPLVGMVEGGARDGHITDGQRRFLYEMLSPLFSFGADTVILGCTHFPALYSEISEILRPCGVKHVISSVKEGCDSFLRSLGRKGSLLSAKKRSYLSQKGG